MEQRFELSLKSSDGLCELIVKMSTAFAGEAANETEKAFFRQLAQKALAQHDSIDEVYETMRKVAVVMMHESRDGSLEQKYSLPIHEVIGLIYDRVMGN